MKVKKVAYSDLLTNKQINSSTLVRIPIELHQKLKIEAACMGKTIKGIVTQVIEAHFKQNSEITKNLTYKRY